MEQREPALLYPTLMKNFMIAENKNKEPKRLKKKEKSSKFGK